MTRTHIFPASVWLATKNGIRGVICVVHAILCQGPLLILALVGLANQCRGAFRAVFNMLQFIKKEKNCILVETKTNNSVAFSCKIKAREFKGC